MNEAQKIWLAIYTAALQGWLANGSAPNGTEAHTAEQAHAIALHAAQLGIIAIAEVGRQEPT